MDTRTEFALRALKTDNFSELCREYGISTKTGYKWRNRLLHNGLAGLQEGSRKPRHSPNELKEEVTCRIVLLKQRHPFWGARKLQTLYAREWGTPPAESSIKRVLERVGMVERRRVRAVAQTGRIATGRQAQAPNDVWTVDFKGWWHDPAGRCNPLTIRDEYSRMVLELRHLDSGTGEAVRRCFERLFELHGLPAAIRSDNGAPFACGHALLGLTRLSAWWLKLGIELERSRPASPQDNGAHERMHKDIACELQKSGVYGTGQAALDVWREEFNTVRPHESLGMRTPAEVWERSPRRYSGEAEQISYEGMEVRRINRVGKLRFQGRSFQITTALDGCEVGLRASATPGQWELHYCRLLLGHVEPQTSAFLPSAGVHGRVEKAAAPGGARKTAAPAETSAATAAPCAAGPALRRGRARSATPRAPGPSCAPAPQRSSL